MLKLGNLTVPFEVLLQASMLDQLSFLAWTKTEDAQNNVGRPKSMVRLLTKSESEREFETFMTAEEFDAIRSRIIEGD